MSSLSKAFTTLAKKLHSGNFQHSRNSRRNYSAGRILPANTGGSQTWISPKMPIFKYFSLLCESNTLPLQISKLLLNYYCLMWGESLAMFGVSLELLSSPSTPDAYKWCQEVLPIYKENIISKVATLLFSQDCSSKKWFFFFFLIWRHLFSRLKKSCFCRVSSQDICCCLQPSS